MTSKMSPIEITMRLVQSMGPVTRSQIERELIDQCQFTHTNQDAVRQANKSIQHGLAAGWLIRYDRNSFDVQPG